MSLSYADIPIKPLRRDIDWIDPRKTATALQALCHPKSDTYCFAGLNEQTVGCADAFHFCCSNAVLNHLTDDEHWNFSDSFYPVESLIFRVLYKALLLIGSKK